MNHSDNRLRRSKASTWILTMKQTLGAIHSTSTTRSGCLFFQVDHVLAGRCGTRTPLIARDEADDRSPAPACSLTGQFLTHTSPRPLTDTPVELLEVLRSMGGAAESSLLDLLIDLVGPGILDQMRG